MDPRKASSLLIAWLFLTASGVYAGQAGAFALCEERFAAQPELEKSAQCFFDVGRDPALRDEAIHRLETHLARHPQLPWLSFYLGNLRWREPATLKLYRTAADLFIDRTEIRGEVRARFNLYQMLLDHGSLEEAEREVVRAMEAAEASDEPLLIARGLILHAKYLTRLGEDLWQAFPLLRRAEEIVFSEGGDYPLQRDLLVALVDLHFKLGRIQEAKAARLRLVELATAAGDPYAMAVALYDLSVFRLEELTELPREEDREIAMDLLRQALKAAVAARHGAVEAKAHGILGLLTRGEEARQHLERCLAVALEEGVKSYCLSVLARHLTADQPTTAQTLIDQARHLADQTKNPQWMVFPWREQMRLSWSAGSPERAIADSRSALDTIEALRDLEIDSESLSHLFSNWTEDYYWFSGRLFKSFLAGQGSEHLDQAFAVTERLRARTLIDALEAARAAALPPAPELGLRLAEVLEEIAKVQRKLLDPALPSSEQHEAMLERDQLEAEEAEIRSQIERAHPGFAELRRPEFASLSQVRQSLASDEALLSFQVAAPIDLAGDPVDGSWLLVATRDATRIYRVPDRVRLRSKIRFFTGLFARRDGEETVFAVSLFHELLEAAMDELAPGIERLTIIPDDEALHLLPFAALRRAAEAETLAERFQLSLVPSATLWQRWRENKPLPAEVPALVLADPVPLGFEEDRSAAVAVERGGLDAGVPHLGPLPHSRREGKAVVSHLGGGSVLQMGKEASELFLKDADLKRFGILHFATHALTDYENPQRSAVILTPGSEAEDGQLRIREIVDLELDGRIVVLSSCRSASGAVLRGEGVMGLARAFFQAGAHTVVASLWPLRDDDAARLFDRFYQYLAEGRSVAGALRAAQRNRIAAGAPAAAWAGLVVLGDGELVPVPGGTPRFRHTDWRWALVVGGVICALLLLGSLVLRRRGASA